MAIEVKRVPMDFEWPIQEVWSGYINPNEDEPFDSIDPPTGDGYQLWETVSEGSPLTPVFASLEELQSWTDEHVNPVWLTVIHAGPQAGDAELRGEIRGR